MILQQCQWCQEAADALREELSPDEALIRSEVERGISKLWRIDGGWLVTRPETYHDGSRELVLVAIRGRDINDLMAVVKAAAIEAGFPSIRYHSSRPGAARFTKQWGFDPAETVYRCELTQ